MKIILKFTLAIVIATSIASCSAVHIGSMENSASLSSANFSYVKQNLEGKAQATYVLGIGGLAKETLVDQAKKKMLADNPLKNNQTLVSRASPTAPQAKSNNPTRCCCFLFFQIKKVFYLGYESVVDLLI